MHVASHSQKLVLCESLQKSKWIKNRPTEFKIEQLKGVIIVCSHLQGNAEISVTLYPLQWLGRTLENLC